MDPGTGEKPCSHLRISNLPVNFLKNRQIKILLFGIFVLKLVNNLFKITDTSRALVRHKLCLATNLQNAANEKLDYDFILHKVGHFDLLERKDALENGKFTRNYG